MIQRAVAAKRTRVAVTPPTNGTPPDNKSHPSNRSKIIGGFTNDFAMINPKPKPRTHIAFLKVHKAASSTVQNILYRFGSGHDLSFVLPQNGHYISKVAGSYGNIVPSLDDSGKYDILCNHVVFNERKFRSLMFEDAFYLAIVRHPLKRFVSAAYYYRYVYENWYLSNMNQTTFLHDLITDPLKFEPKLLKGSKTFNRQAFDFGIVVSSLKEVMNLDESTKNMFLSHIMEQFHFVMIVEKFDESLVMLKRYLNWTIKDILYIKQNQFRNATDNASSIIIQNVTAEDEAIFKLTNQLEYLIYDKFVERFNEMAAKEKDLDAEVKEFKRKLELVEAFCTIDTTRRDALFWETEFNAAFRVSRYDCMLMLKNELEFNNELRKAQRFRLKDRNRDKMRY